MPEAARSVRDDLASVGAELAAADAARAVAIDRAGQAARRAEGEGVPVAEVARLLGLSRVTVYRLQGHKM